MIKRAKLIFMSLETLMGTCRACHLQKILRDRSELLWEPGNGQIHGWCCSLKRVVNDTGTPQELGGDGHKRDPKTRRHQTSDRLHPHRLLTQTHDEPCGPAQTAHLIKGTRIPGAGGEDKGFLAQLPKRDTLLSCQGVLRGQADKQRFSANNLQCEGGIQERRGQKANAKMAPLRRPHPLWCLGGGPL